MNAPDETKRPAQESQFEIVEYAVEGRKNRLDLVVTEEPLEIRVVHGPADQRKMRSVSITMRTPGHDQELAAGFLMSEQILNSHEQINEFKTLGVDTEGQVTGNIVRVDVAPDVVLDLGRLQRHFFTTSSCGVCGKASLEALEVQGLKPVTNDSFVLGSAEIKRLPDKLLSHQQTFNRTGGLHAAGLFDSNGQLLDSREDVGRHNAVDKLIGGRFLKGTSCLLEYGMIVSGRVSFEIMQKALTAHLPMIVAVGAPSSLAVEMARQYNMTLIGFASPDRFNVYAGQARVQ